MLAFLGFGTFVHKLEGLGHFHGMFHETLEFLTEIVMREVEIRVKSSSQRDRSNWR